MKNAKNLKYGKGAGTWLKTFPNELGGFDVTGNCDKCDHWPCEHSDLSDANRYAIEGKEFDIPMRLSKKK